MSRRNDASNHIIVCMYVLVKSKLPCSSALHSVAINKDHAYVETVDDKMGLSTKFTITKIAKTFPYVTYLKLLP